jgi:predicted nucleotidyltransferase
MDGMELAPGVQVDGDALASFCRVHRIRRLALFGSALGSGFGPESDVDLLVEFEPGGIPGLIRLAALELELEGIVGREVELRTLYDLSPYFRNEVATGARTLYAVA